MIWFNGKNWKPPLTTLKAVYFCSNFCQTQNSDFIMLISEIMTFWYWKCLRVILKCQKWSSAVCYFAKSHQYWYSWIMSIDGYSKKIILPSDSSLNLYLFLVVEAPLLSSLRILGILPDYSRHNVTMVSVFNTTKLWKRFVLNSGSTSRGGRDISSHAK